MFKSGESILWFIIFIVPDIGLKPLSLDSHNGICSVVFESITSYVIYDSYWKTYDYVL